MIRLSRRTSTHTGFHDFNLAEWGESYRFDERDWETYKRLRAGVAGGPKSLQLHAGDTGNFWTDDGVEIWAPTQALEQLAVDKDEPNILSMVLKITYKGRSIVLGGDATSDETWPEILAYGRNGHVDVLKASHHGRKTGYYGPAVKAMSPWLTITSVAEAEHDATPSYRRYSDYTVSLRKAETSGSPSTIAARCITRSGSRTTGGHGRSRRFATHRSTACWSGRMPSAMALGLASSHRGRLPLRKASNGSGVWGKGLNHECS